MEVFTDLKYRLQGFHQACYAPNIVNASELHLLDLCFSILLVVPIFQAVRCRRRISHVLVNIANPSLIIVKLHAAVMIRILSLSSAATVKSKTWVSFCLSKNSLNTVIFASRVRVFKVLQ